MVKKAAPQFLDRLCELCRNHFKALLEFLEENALPYVLNPHLVRGLDYYTRTVFELFVEERKAATEEPPTAAPAPERAASDGAPAHEAAPVKRLAVVGGGRYDGLIELVGGRPTPAVGGALGLERLVAIVKERGTKVPPAPKTRAFVVQLGELAKRKSFRVMEELRRAGISAAESLGRDSIRSQLKVADRLGAEYALIIGQKEALDGMVILREMSSGIQETILQARLIETMKRKFKSHPRG